MDISIAIREDVRKNASVKNQRVSSSIRAATALLSFKGYFLKIWGCQYLKSAIFLFLRKKIVFTRDYIYLPRLTYRAKHDLPILLLHKNLFWGSFSHFRAIFEQIIKYFSKFQPFLSMNVLNMLVHFMRTVFWGKLCFKA